MQVGFDVSRRNHPLVQPGVAKRSEEVCRPKEGCEQAGLSLKLVKVLHEHYRCAAEVPTVHMQLIHK